jgi:hypothetical protein
MLPALSAITAAQTHAAQQDRTIVAMARLLRNQREQGQAVVSLIEQANQDGRGRIIDVRA